MRMADVYPAMTAEIVALLRAEGSDVLAEGFGDLLYYGNCPCTPRCTCLSTNADGAPGSFLITLERDGEPLFWLHLTDSAAVAAVEILDGRAPS